MSATRYGRPVYLTLGASLPYVLSRIQQCATGDEAHSLVAVDTDAPQGSINDDTIDGCVCRSCLRGAGQLS